MHLRRAFDRKFKLGGAAFLTLVLAAVLGAGPARAQVTGTVSVDIEVPPLLILYYHGNLDLTIPPGALEHVLNGAQTVNEGNLVISTPENLGQLEGDNAGYNPAALTGDPTSVSMLIKRTWAVRSIGSGATTVSILPGDMVLEGPGIASIEINSVQAQPAAFAPTGLSTSQVGNLLLNLDVENADAAGSYGDANTQFTIRVTQL
jgi:hypothetical protein